MIVHLVDSIEVADHIKTFRFQPTSPVDYIAGQYIQLVIPHDNADERGIKRFFTLSSSPTDEYLTITTKLAADKPSSFKQALWKLEPGAELEMASPEGDFTLPADEAVQLVFVAGGIGITPFHSMIKYLCDKHETRNITLLYSVATQPEMAFNDLFSSCGVTLIPLVGQRITAEKILEIVGEPEGTLIYLSGPEPMVESLYAKLKETGLTDDQVKGDYFPGYHNDYSS